MVVFSSILLNPFADWRYFYSYVTGDGLILSARSGAGVPFLCQRDHEGTKESVAAITMGFKRCITVSGQIPISSRLMWRTYIK